MTISQFIAKKTGRGKRHAKSLLENGEVFLNHQSVTDGSLALAKFDHLIVSGEVLQSRIPRHLLLHKPAGIVSATTDTEHRTVIDLIDEPWAHELHLAGRLDRATTGLVILTNDSGFSESLTRPEEKTPKRYHVTTDQIIPTELIEKFRRGMSFDKEKTRSQPAIVEPLTATSLHLTIYEGLHHQIKRMFLRFQIRVTSLHRLSIGPHHLPTTLAPGQYQSFTPHP